MPKADHSGVRRVAIIAYEDFQILDVTGPLEVFGRVSRLLREQGATRGDAYRAVVAAREPGPVRCSSGFEIVASCSYRDLGGVDTLLVAGGIGTPAAQEDAELLAFLRRRAPTARRYGAVCTGSLVLAAAGLLDGRRATTHWGWMDRLAALAPTASLEPDAIFVRDERLWTSAGVTAGMDMALAMVEEDWGRDAALMAARQLVLFLKRPGGQSQYSAHLAAQETIGPARFEALKAWLLAHLDQDLSVEALAGQCAMSPRNFARAFVREVGTTPAKFVERARVDEARRLLEDSRLGVDQVAARCGFGTAETLRRVFLRRLAVAPSAYRDRFAAARPA